MGSFVQIGRAFGVRDASLRLHYELQRYVGLLGWRMRPVEGWNAWKLSRIAPGVSAEQMRLARAKGARPFFFGDVRTVGTRLEGILGPEGKQCVLAEAERTLEGDLPYFGQLCFHCGFPPHWFRNPATGQTVSPQQSWTRMRFASPVYGDLKFILEPSRFLFVYPLVRAYALSGDERFPQAFWRVVEDWARRNPPMSGPLWICGQECSLRVLAWSFGLHGFIHSPSATNDRVAMLVSMIASHAWRTAQTLGYARSQRSNHLISEAVGLWTAGTLYPELRDAQAWQKLGAQLLREAVLDQITEEGVSQQHSFNYQRMILHLLLWSLRLSEVCQAPLHEDISCRARAALDFMRCWVDPTSGMAPNYGSDDGSLVLPLASGAYRDFRPLLQLGATVLGHPHLAEGAWDEAALWFGAEFRPPNRGDSITAPSARSGYFRLGDGDSWALVRAGRYTRRPFQADQLHVDLWWRGINVARDAGTYLYNGSPPWNNGLAGTKVHNTVTIDGRGQMRRAGRFLWLDWAQASGRVFSADGDARPDRFEGEHDGYRRLGIKHRRTVQWLPDVGWVVVDTIEGPGEHSARLHWLLCDLPFEFSDSPFQAILQAGRSRIVWNLFASVPANAAVVRAGKRIAVGENPDEQRDATDFRGPDFLGKDFPDNEAQILGWESPTYGELRPAISLIYEARSLLPIRFVSVVLTNERCRVETSRNELSVLYEDAEIYRVSVRPSGRESVPATISRVTVPTA